MPEIDVSMLPDNWVQCQGGCGAHLYLRQPYDAGYCKGCRKVRRALRAFGRKLDAAAKRYYRNVKKGIV